MNDGFFKVAAATPSIKVADCEYNKNQILEQMRECEKRGVTAVVFPELCLTGYTCGDLFRDRTLITAAQKALGEILEQTRSMNLLAVIGLPVPVGADLYNCAAVICRGKLLGLPAKSSIPNYSEFYEARHFTPAPAYAETRFCGKTVPLGNSLIFRCESMPELVVGVEICEDLWTACPPSAQLAQCGATLLLNPSASDEIIGKAPYRRNLVNGQSARLIAAYAYADAGEGESSTDLVYAGHNVIAENGTVLAESTLFTTGLTVADVDLQRMLQERLRTTTWSNAGEAYEVSFTMDMPVASLERKFPALPFVPDDTKDLSERCEMILNMQAAGLKTRLKHTGSKCAVIGVSGGLDSTLALLVIVRAFDLLKLDRKGILAVTMPGFGTTKRTKSNAQRLSEMLGVTLKEIPIGDSVSKHFEDIDHDPNVRDVTYENAQARERTQVLMDLANQCGGLVIGTGDLSELALGWATYNGDIMSMYGVNCSIPKTLVRHLVHHAAITGGKELCALLEDVLDTPVSPELLPPENGVIAQKTENIVGPYELHDFFLYYMLRFGFTPSKIFHMAQSAFAGIYDDATIKKWLTTFYKRFFMHQFKRSCLPDGPKVGSVTLSPRGDWRMPSDASSALWLREIESL
ncbi:NAD(+) synthase [Caproiciproducens faecalis]|uniref:Glutamine-dependent NAD(+) synthetase n=1 Tax=Caproiciproducens faecalis TaxID=2820301 RepID=A0ABS7DP67_9FIRM|nr:NAD(+) synthase [Caproiciproducens faecalis]MBW7573101.1 NAD(+) synthase [Caproiciproducens faecalis]